MPFPSDASDFSSPQGYDLAVIDAVWRSGERIAGNDPDLWRKDRFGAWIHRLEYGRRQSQFGWEIGGVAPAAPHPLQWQNYVDQVAAATRSRITADGLRNVRKLI